MRPDPAVVGAGRSRRVRAGRAVNGVVSAAVVAASLRSAPDAVLAVGLAALLCTGLEVLRPGEAVEPRTPRQWAVDLTHALGNRLPIVAGVQLLLLLAAGPVRWMTPSAAPSWYGDLHPAAGFAALFVLTDLTNYAVHRLSHEVPALWRFHRVHHSSGRLDWLATARGHPVDQILAFGAIAMPAMALDAPADAAPVVVALYLWPFVCHANHSWSGAWMERFVVSPRFHHWHHARAPVNRNYGAVLTVWDRWFGTAVAAPGFPPGYGTDDLPDGGTYVDHLVSPFRRP